MSERPAVSERAAADDRNVAPSRSDPVVRSASEVAGGPLGRYAVPLVRGWRYTATLLVAASAAPLVLAVMLRGYCLDSGWRTPDQFWHACFSDLPATFNDAGLGGGFLALVTGAVDAPTPAQPPLTALVMSALGGAVPDGSSEARMRFYFGLWAVLAAVLWALTTWWTAAAVRRVPLRAAHVALSPVVALTVLVGPDVLGVALTAAAVLAWSRSRPVWSGLLFGLACSARSYPVLILLAALFLALRVRRLRDWAATAVTAAVTFGGCLALVAIGNPEAAVRAYRAWASAGAGFGSPWLIPQLADAALPVAAVTALAVLGWLLALTAGALVALAAPTRPGLAEVALVMVAVALVTGTSVPVQASLWLVPLVALAGLRWRDHLLWAAAELGYFVAVWLYIAGQTTPDRGLPAGWYAMFLTVRLLGIGWLAVAARQQAWQRTTAQEGDRDTDQLTGVLSGAPDRLVVRFG